MDGGSRETLHELDERTRYLTPIFGSEAADAPMPVSAMNDTPVVPRVASEMIREYLSIEGNAVQNLATFCQTYMEPAATQLMAENLEKNAVDKDEYPMTADLENRCVRILADLWNADEAEEPMGTSTVGSSEACMLGGLAMLFRWKALADAAGVDRFTRTRPNLVISSGYQVCWEKFCRYWDIEMRLVPMMRDKLELDVDAAMEMVDDHTIGIVAILGITYSGHYDDVKALDAAVARYNEEHPSLPVRIHGWLVPAYPMPADIEDMDVQRLVLRQDFSMPLAMRPVADMKREVAVFESRTEARMGSFDHSGR